jgi:hypothetical protein
MPNDQHSPHGRRPHFHRGRRGADRRGGDRRNPPHAPEASARDQVDVEQIMRDIRSRISRRHGIDLTAQQIQELAARRLEAILEPKHVKPALLEQMRRAAGEPVDVPSPPAPDAGAPLEESALYASHRGVLRTLRRWLNPILKLFINPAPLIRAINAQDQRAREASAREAELYARQAEWNALHYEIVQRLVTEVSRATIETQNLAMRVESLAAKVDFNERRVRGLESAGPAARPPGRAPAATLEPARDAGQPAEPPPADAADSALETARRRRRRRRGRRSGVPGMADATGAGRPAATIESDSDLEPDLTDTDAEGAEVGGDLTGPGAAAPLAAGPTALEPAHAFSLLQPVERHPSAEPSAAPAGEPSPATPLAAPGAPGGGPADAMPPRHDAPEPQPPDDRERPGPDER